MAKAKGRGKEKITKTVLKIALVIATELVMDLKKMESAQMTVHVI